MIQIVGHNCARCGMRIFSSLDAEFCSACGNPIHSGCRTDQQVTSMEPARCASCGGDPTNEIARDVKRERENSREQARAIEKRKEDLAPLPWISDLHRFLFRWAIVQFNLLSFLVMIGVVIYSAAVKHYSFTSMYRYMLSGLCIVGLRWEFVKRRWLRQQQRTLPEGRGEFLLSRYSVLLAAIILISIYFWMTVGFLIFSLF